MPGTKRSNIVIGSKVRVVQKQDQPTGKLTEGVVSKILTNSPNHPHGTTRNTLCEFLCGYRGIRQMLLYAVHLPHYSRK